ncbi:MAG: GTP cyclohydrolase [Alphaproteobacteria bacterium CG11_big_fil_rev_8_21_14_0_20_44_7]|nr:MAG: GTP cyclohydrolase [Alphaproteobacteria bacterium CG11_big_fil_rev_8_21_14_0_20_44_7]
MSIVDVDRAAFELRHGREVEIDGQIIIHPEFLTEKIWQNLATQNLKLLVTPLRAKAIFNQEFTASVEIKLSDLSLQDVVLLVAGHSNANPKYLENATEQNTTALKLARIAELLPCAIILENSEDAYKISAADIMSYKEDENNSLFLAAETPLKLADAKKAYIKAFRPKSGNSEHLAIIIGDISENPLMRIHSSCYTGDLLGSLACDCGDQLRECIKLMDKQGGGIILYLLQEGRGIGLINKLRAYQLQKSGMDTVEANEFLGFDDEERGFESAANMLKILGITSVQIVTNNPKKAQDIENLGIKVTNRVPLLVSHEHNEQYLQVKSAKSGHIID